MTPIKLLAHYCDDPEKRYVSELPEMEKPVEWIDGRKNKYYHFQTKVYQDHLASRPKYPAPWLTPSMHNKEVECLLQWQVKRLTGDWEDCDRITFGWAHNHLEQRTRIIALPIEQSKGEGEKIAGHEWEKHIKQFEKLGEYWHNLPEITRTWLAQQIDIFAGKYPATSPSAAGEDNNKLWDEVGEYLKKQSFIFPAIENLKSKFSITRK